VPEFITAVPDASMITSVI